METFHERTRKLGQCLESAVGRKHWAANPERIGKRLKGPDITFQH